MTGLLNPFAVETILAEVREERARQDTQWGEQNLRNATGPQSVPLAYFDSLTSAEDLAEGAREIVDAGFAEQLCTYRDLLLEEVFEALAEADPQQLRRELVQVAAVAVQWIEAIDRRRRGGQLRAVEAES